MRALVGKGNNCVTVECSPREKDNLKGLPGSRYSNGVWTLPLTLPSLWMLRSVFGPEMESTEEIAAWAWQAHARREEVLSLRAGNKYLAGLPEQLFDFQRTGSSWMACTGRVLLADSMGTGKTFQTQAAISALPDTAYPVLVISTNSMKHTWKREWEQWFPGREVVVIEGSAAQRKKLLAGVPEAGIAVINWEALRTLSRLAPYGSVALKDKEREDGPLNLRGFRTVIADEAHRMVDPKAKQTRATWALMHAATYRFALTGTPVVNSPEDVWSILHGLAPEEWPARTKFIDRYCISGPGRHGGIEVYGLNPNRKEEFFKILDPRYLRRTKEEVLDDFPAKLPPQYRYVEMAPKQEKAYKQMEKHLMAEAEDGSLIVASNDAVKDGRLQQAAAGTLAMSEDGSVTLAMPSCKVDLLMEVLEESGDDPLVVFAVHRGLIELCAQALDKAKISYVKLTGEQAPEERTFGVSEFQDGSVRVALCTLGAASEGITLTRANRSLFLQRHWSNVKNQQAEDRTHRIGQEREVEIIIGVTLGTREFNVLANNATKEEMAQEINRDGERTSSDDLLQV